MTLEQLHYFSAAAQLGSFSKAAENVHISQPSLSVAIRKLEKELGVALFYPNRKGAILTEAGRLFLEDAQNVLLQMDVTVMHMRQYAESDRAEIRIAYTSSVADVYIPRLLKGFLSEEGKGCCIYSDEMPSDQIAKGIREGHFDLGIGSQIPPDPELEQIPIEYQRFCLLLPESERSPERYQCVESLQGAELVCYRQNYPMYRQLSSLFTHWQIHPHIMQYTYSENAIARLVEQGLGIAIVAETEGLERFRVRILHPDWLEGGRYIYLFKHRTHRVSGAVQQLEKRIVAQKAVNV